MGPLIYYVAEYVRKLGTNFGRSEEPSAQYVRYLVKKVKETGILIDEPKREKPKTVRTPENIAAVTEKQLTIEHFGDIIGTNIA